MGRSGWLAPLVAVAFLAGGTLVAGAQVPAASTTSIPTVTPAIVACIDVPTPAPPAAALHIVASHSPDTHAQFAAGETVVLSGTAADGLAPGQRFFIRRAERGRDGRRMSADAPGAIHTAGWLTVQSADEHSALARIDYTCDAAFAGDYLEPFTEPAMASASGPDGPPRFDDPARVLFGRDRREELGAGDLFSMDRGTTQGVTPGARVLFYRDRVDGTPLVELGEGHVVAADAASARVLITRSRDAVRRGDLVVPRTR